MIKDVLHLKNSLNKNRVKNFENNESVYIFDIKTLDVGEIKKLKLYYDSPEFMPKLV